MGFEQGRGDPLAPVEHLRPAEVRSDGEFGPSTVTDGEIQAGVALLAIQP